MKALIEKYFEGETTLEEEALLRDYFNNGQVSEELMPYQPLFQYFSTERGQELSAGFEADLFEKLEANESKVVRMRTWPRNLLRIAAVGVVLVTAMVYLQKPISSSSGQTASVDWSKYEITDEKKAYDETVKALKLVSAKLNKGSKKATQEVAKMEKLGKYFN